eukprot:2880787-Rhodomonas_salina.2
MTSCYSRACVADEELEEEVLALLRVVLGEEDGGKLEQAVVAALERCPPPHSSSLITHHSSLITHHSSLLTHHLSLRPSVCWQRLRMDDGHTCAHACTQPHITSACAHIRTHISTRTPWRTRTYAHASLCTRPLPHAFVRHSLRSQTEPSDADQWHQIDSEAG